MSKKQKIESENDQKEFSSVLSSINNILIAHKDAKELRDYRRIFYTVFLMFCILFLLGVFGLWNIKHSYELKLLQKEKEYQEKIENMEFVLSNQLEQEKFDLFIQNLDLESDDSITKYVDPKVSYTNKWYVPDDLVPVWGKHLIDAKGWYIKVHKIAKQQMEALAKQFYDETNQEIVVVSGYRSYSYQQWIKDRWCPDHLCAKAGHSEHQSWYAIDLYSASTKEQWMASNTLRKHFDWLNANAHVYGFHNPYRKWREIDGYNPEPWHWRYVGEKLARYLKQNDLTFAEFYYSRK